MKRFLKQWFGSPKKQQPIRNNRPRLAVEGLEERTVPATLQMLDGVLTYNAGAAISNNLSVTLNNGTYTLTDTAEKINVLGIAGATGSGTNTVTIPASQLTPLGMLVHLNDGNDTMTIHSAAHAVSVQAGLGNDTIHIGNATNGNLVAIQAPVHVDTQDGTDVVRINDQAGILGNFNIKNTQVSRLNGPTVTYANAENLILTAGSSSDQFRIESTAVGTRTTINGGIGTTGDSFTVGNAALTLDDIQGTLTLNGGDQNSFLSDSVAFLDQGNTVSRSYTLRANSLARSGGASIAFNEMESLSLNTGSAADSVAVSAAPANMPVNLNLGAGNDRVDVGTTASPLSNILSKVTVNGEAGTDTVVINDQANAFGGLYLVNSTDVYRGFANVLNYTNAESLTLNASNMNDMVTVHSTLASTPVTLKMGNGDDTVYIQNAIQSMDDIQGVVTVDGQAGIDSLYLNDQGENEYHDYTVTANSVSRNGAANINYANQENLVITAGSPLIIELVPSIPVGNNFFVKGTSANTVLQGTARYTSNNFFVGSNTNSLDGIQGALSVTGGGVLHINDQGDNNGNNYTITSNTIARSGAAPITYAVGYNNGLTVNTGNFSDSVDLRSTSSDVTVNLGNGNDIFTVNETQYTSTITLSDVHVSGQGGNDSLVVNPSARGHSLIQDKYDIYANNLYRTSGDSNRFWLSHDSSENLTINSGDGVDTFKIVSTAASTPVVIRSGAGNDLFKFGDYEYGPRNPSTLLGAVTLDGQEGFDTVDYSAYDVGVRVNLATGTATGAAGGISNIESATGGFGNDILIGNDMDNVLIGNAGRDILIGRGGMDVLLGGSGDDILIGESTVHDLNPSAMEDIMREWGRTDLVGTPQQQFDARVFHLILPSFGGGLNGSTALSSSHVNEDNANDSIDGGADLDWILTPYGTYVS